MTPKIFEVTLSDNRVYLVAATSMTYALDIASMEYGGVLGIKLIGQFLRQDQGSVIREAEQALEGK